MGFDFRNTFSPDHTGTEVSERSNQQISDGFSSGAAITNGVLIRSASLTGGSVTSVPTKLGRGWIGYIICGQSADARIWTTDMSNRSSLSLQSNNDVNVVIWVF